EEILQAPATEYVALFVEGASPQHVLKASHIMQKPDALIRVSDGPRVALREMQSEGLSSVFAVERDRTLAGLVLVDDAIEAIKRKEPDVRRIVITDVPKVSPDTSMDELIAIGAEARYPVAVVDEANRLQGIVVRVNILSGLISSSAREAGDEEERP